MRVLVIEDFELLRDSICQGLREAGFAVDTAADGTAGLWHARSGQFDVIILDLMLPGVDGLTVLRELRAGGVSSHVLILTARDTTSDRITRPGCWRGRLLMVKPFAFAELVARVPRLGSGGATRPRIPYSQWRTWKLTPRRGRCAAAARRSISRRACGTPYWNSWQQAGYRCDALRHLAARVRIQF